MPIRLYISEIIVIMEQSSTLMKTMY